jgi:hypothetical protein
MMIYCHFSLFVLSIIRIPVLYRSASNFLGSNPDSAGVIELPSSELIQSSVTRQMMFRIYSGLLGHIRKFWILESDVVIQKNVPSIAVVRRVGLKTFCNIADHR